MAAATDHRIEDHAMGRIADDAPLSRRVAVRLRFDPERSPVTVRFAFPGGTEWAFPRALLEAGLRAPARQGAVGVWPCGRVQTVVEFHTGGGAEVVQFDTKALRRFLQHTYASTATSAASATSTTSTASTQDSDDRP